MRALKATLIRKPESRSDLAQKPLEIVSILNDIIFEQHTGFTLTTFPGLSSESKPDHLGRFKIIEVLGQGAMGIVYKAADEVIDRTVAIKTLQVSGQLTDEQRAEFKQRFRMEAQLAGKLSHPNIVTIYDVAEEDGIMYIAMEFVDGRTLEYLINHTPTNWESLQSIEMAIEIMLQTCDGLHFAHEHDVTHRDIKPANIIISKNGHAKIMDFGIAKINSSSGTAIGTILGTPGYMSPEQIAGKQVDQRSDIFSLGSVCYECLTGKKAFDGNNMTEVMYKVMNENPTPVHVLNPMIPPVFDNIITRALRRNPEERYRSVDLMAKDIRKIKQTMLLSRTIYVDADLAATKFNVPLLEKLGLADFRKLSIGLGLYSGLTTLLLLLSLIFGGGGGRISESLTSGRPASLRLRINVPDAHVLLDEKPLQGQNGLYTLDAVSVGEHKLVVKREYYAPYETALVFGAGEYKEIMASLNLAPIDIPQGADTSYISVMTDPPMARVETSTGRFIGYSPFDDVLFPGGKYTLLISKTDHVTTRRDVSLRRNRSSALDLKLEKVRSVVSLDRVVPPEAGLWINGRRQARAGKSNAYRVEVGEQTLVVRADGYLDVEKKVFVKSDSVIALSDTLTPTFGSLLLTSNPSGADIFLDGQDETIGETPKIVTSLLASVHTVQMKRGKETRTRQIRVVKDDTTDVKLVFSSPNGYFDIVTTPPGADIYINTIQRKDTRSPSTLEIKPGYYRVRLSHPSFKKFYEATLRVRPDQVTRVTHTFE